jgi:cell volume regulation protein A
MEYLHQLVYIAIVLLLGTLASVFAYSLKTSDIFILLLAGMLLGSLGVLSFDNNFIIIASIFALIFVVFNSSLDFKLKEVKRYLGDSLKLTFVYMVLCVVILSLAMIYVFGLEFSVHNLLLGMLFSFIAYGTDPTAVLSLFEGTKNKFVEIIEIESILNTPLTVIPAFLILNTLQSSKFQVFSITHNPFFSFLQLIVVGILVALIIGWFVVFIFRHNYFGKLTHLAVFTSAIIVYAGAEYLGGSGVLAIAIYGLIFGNSHISHLIEIEKFESILTNGIKIITFMLLGTIILITPSYIVKGTIIFCVYIFIRFISAMITLRKEKINFKSALFIAFNVPKGVDVALILLLTLSIHSGVENMDIVINLAMIMVLYSIALSSIAGQFSNYLLGIEKGRKNVKKIQGN